MKEMENIAHFQCQCKCKAYSYKINDNIVIFYNMKNMNKQRKSLALMDR